jgi:hypothetical protein
LRIADPQQGMAEPAAAPQDIPDRPDAADQLESGGRMRPRVDDNDVETIMTKQRPGFVGILRGNYHGMLIIQQQGR